MGLRLISAWMKPGAGAEEETRRRRFGAYFPRVFAFAQHLLGDERAASEAVVDAFARVFERGDEAASEETFRINLFRTARDLCNGSDDSARVGGRLSLREHQLLGLVFDAQLDKEEVAAVLEVSEETISEELLSALRKLNSAGRSSIVPSFLRRP